jgi:hypothetical protein
MQRNGVGTGLNQNEDFGFNTCRILGSSEHNLVLFEASAEDVLLSVQYEIIKKLHI